jgi:AcrR family transcriptional regulator
LRWGGRAAAREAFAELGMAGTSVRAIARSADVDPALVYHYYGSKNGLLDACTTPPAEFLESVAAVWASPRRELGVRLVTNLVEIWGDERLSPIIRSILLIAEHDPRTKEKLRLVIESSLMGPALRDLDAPERAMRAGLVSTQLMGLAFVRYVWKVDPIASMSDDEIVAAVAPNVQRFIDGDITIPRRRRPRPRSSGASSRSRSGVRASQVETTASPVSASAGRGPAASDPLV